MFLFLIYLRTEKGVIVLMIIAVPLVLSAGPAGAPPAAADPFAAASNQFAFDVWKKLGSGGNQAFSPASMALALCMTGSGAKGDTEREMRKALRWSEPLERCLPLAGRLSASLADPARKVTFRIANRLFGDNALVIEKAYQDAVSKELKAPVERVDFRKEFEKARARINTWVEEQTEKRIRDLVPAGGVNALTRLVLVNALYFLGDWENPFDPVITRPGPFRISKSETRQVPTMHQTGHLRFFARDGISAVELPYQGNAYSMLFVLPDRVDGLPELEQKLDAERIAAIARDMKPQRVHVALPRFTLDPGEPLRAGNILQALGMRLAFDMQKADFSTIARWGKPEDRLYIGEVYHKVFVKVDEKGTEAAAATAVAMEAGCAPARPAEFIADHPFLFFLRDNQSGLIIFMGRVNDPSKS